MADPSRHVAVGRITGLFGVRGWVKVHSYTRPREALLGYSPWFLVHGTDQRSVVVAESHVQGHGLVARIEGYADREHAQELVGVEIAVPLERLPTVQPGEYYWAQLEGLIVINRAGQTLGSVSHLLETGANDVLVVTGERERLIPFGGDVIDAVDLAGGVIRVDWDAED